MDGFESEDPQGTEHRGVLAQIRFQRDGFLIGVLQDGSAVKGALARPELGLEYAFEGEWVHDPRFGPQFAFARCRALRPRDLESMRRYLEQRGENIGPTLSGRLIEHYGEQALEVCKLDPERVAREVPGLRLPVAEALAERLRESEADEACALELGELFDGVRVPRAVVERIRTEWGALAAERVREDPYGLIGSFVGIGFTTADALAARAGYAPDDPRRLRAGVLHLLREQAHAGGHTCLPEEQLVLEAAALLSVEPFDARQALETLCERGALVRSGGRIAFRHYHEAEIAIATRVRRLSGPRVLPGLPQLDDLAEDQQRALANALGCGVFILTGGPGTGKSYTVRRILDSFPEARVALAAPTGKAAKRLAELSGREAQTVHRLLEPIYQPGSGFVFRRDAGNRLDLDLVVVDEVSMIDVELMSHLLDALPDRARLILVGDTDQLPAVGAGDVLGDLIASGRVPCTALTEIKRQDEGLIIRNCHRIRRGEDIEVDNAHARDFFFVERASEREIAAELLELVAERLPARFGVDPLRDVQVLVPRRQGTTLSCEALNTELQARLNPGRRLERSRFAVGDKVIQTRNNYELEVWNGDLGVVQQIEGRSMLVRFDNPSRVVDLDLHRNDLELGYAVTVHKFQGSEARVVVIPVHASAGALLLQRAWLYTAVSRARQVCVVVGQRREVRRAIQRDAPQRRYTLLEQLLVSSAP